jgi:hypothetical protein
MLFERQKFFRSGVVLVGCLLVPLAAWAQNPGDQIEYKAESYPETWEVGTFVRFTPSRQQAIIREKPSEFYPEGFQRAYDLPNIRPTSRPTAPAQPAPAPLVYRPAAPVIPPAPLPLPAPPPVPAPVFIDAAACGPRPDPTHDRQACVSEVAQQSANWAPCAAGDDVACHRFVRDVVRALAAGDPRWGLISKPRGQASCNETACGGHVGGFGEDVVAYLPDGSTPQQWLGADIVGGAGAAGARPQWMSYGGAATNRPDNLWVKLPQ